MCTHTIMDEHTHTHTHSHTLTHTHTRQIQMDVSSLLCKDAVITGIRAVEIEQPCCWMSIRRRLHCTHITSHNLLAGMQSPNHAAGNHSGQDHMVASFHTSSAGTGPESQHNHELPLQNTRTKQSVCFPDSNRVMQRGSDLILFAGWKSQMLPVLPLDTRVIPATWNQIYFSLQRRGTALHIHGTQSAMFG